MAPFEFNTVPRVTFGVGECRRVGKLAAALGRSAMIVFNGPDTGERVARLLAEKGVRATLRRQRGEPVVADADVAVDEARRAGCDIVIGVGGGSAIDAAK